MIQNVVLSLSGIVGAEYIDKVCGAAEALGIGSAAKLHRLAEMPVAFFSAGACRAS